MMVGLSNNFNFNVFALVVVCAYFAMGNCTSSGEKGGSPRNSVSLEGGSPRSPPNSHHTTSHESIHSSSSSEPLSSKISKGEAPLSKLPARRYSPAREKKTEKLRDHFFGLPDEGREQLMKEIRETDPSKRTKRQKMLLDAVLGSPLVRTSKQPGQSSPPKSAFLGEHPRARKLLNKNGRISDLRKRLKGKAITTDAQESDERGKRAPRTRTRPHTKISNWFDSIEEKKQREFYNQADWQKEIIRAGAATNMKDPARN